MMMRMMIMIIIMMMVIMVMMIKMMMMVTSKEISTDQHKLKAGFAKEKMITLMDWTISCRYQTCGPSDDDSR